MLSYAHGACETPLIGRTIGEDLRRTAARHPDRDALVVRHQGVRLTYAELDALVDRVARGLLAAGIGRGDRVGIWAPNGAEWVLVQYGAARAGAILVNVNPAYRTHELAFVLRQSGTRLLVCADAFKTSDYRAMVAEVRGDCPDLRRVVVLGSGDWEELLAGGDGLPADALDERAAEPGLRRPDQPAVHERHDRVAQGRDAHPPQPAQQRVLRRRAVRLHRARPDRDPRALLPLLRHGHGQPRARPRTAPAWSSPRRPSSPRRRCARCTRSAARRSTACRRCSSPCWPTPPSRRSISPRCARGSWPARRARSRSCGASSARCT